MGTSALMLLGEGPPGQAMSGQAPNLAHAQEIIDILTMLETKTKGNLTQEETALLHQNLMALRMASPIPIGRTANVCCAAVSRTTVLWTMLSMSLRPMRA